MDVHIEPSWKQILVEEFSKPYFSHIKQALVEDKKQGYDIYPSGSDIFRAFAMTPWGDLKVVLLGQDPYHGPWQAHGLSFSVKKWIHHPPSLQNIFKELHQDLWISIPRSGDLSAWAKQGVLLLNSILTVRAGQAASHQHIGWNYFTDAVIRSISLHKKGIIFLLRWAFAQSKGVLIDITKHYILQAAHPSPFSAHKWFFGSRHFSRVNEILLEQGKKQIDWSLDTDYAMIWVEDSLI